MRKPALRPEDARARDSDILAKLNKVQHAAQSQKQATKLNQQRVEWTDQARRLASEARRLEADLQDAAGDLGLLADLAEERQLAGDSIADAWFQVAGVRQLLAQVRSRDPARLRRAPDQALSLHEVLSSVSAALGGLGGSLQSQSIALDQDCSTLRRELRKDLAADGLWSADQRHAEDRCEDLSGEEDTLLERIGDGPEAVYGVELHRLNDEVSAELAQLEQEIAELRKKRAGWDEEAHFRFNCIRRQFQGRSRDLLVDRLSLEFPHISREQLQAHEANCDALKYTSQKQSAAFRQWRRNRLALLRKSQSQLDERQRNEGALAARRQDMIEQRERQKHLHSKLQVERARVSVKREEKQRMDDEERRRRHAAEVEKDQARNKRAQLVKDQTRDYTEKKKEMQVQKEEEAAEVERREAAERAVRAERDAEAVRLRRERDDIKRREAAQQRIAAEQEAREREQRMRAAMERIQVKGERDPERLLKVPARAHAQAYCDPLVCVTRGPHAGFDENRLMSDARYKLSAALQAAGLYGTAAGQEVLSRVPAPRPAQPHQVSNIFASGYPS